MYPDSTLFEQLLTLVIAATVLCLLSDKLIGFVSPTAQKFIRNAFRFIWKKGMSLLRKLVVLAWKKAFSKKKPTARPRTHSRRRRITT